MKANLTLWCLLVLFCSCVQLETSEEEVIKNYFHTEGNRTAAEWEPALGALVTWPLGIPHTLAKALAKDYHLFVMLEDDIAKAQAEGWFLKWGIQPDDVTFIYAKQGDDAWWTRDWGPSAVFASDGQFHLADGKYLYATPLTDLACNDSLEFLYLDDEGGVILTKVEDQATRPLGDQLGYKVLDLPFSNTGGNVLTDGLGSAFSTCVINAENKYHGVSREEFLTLNDSLLGFERYHTISNFESYGMQHIDCFLKLVNEETILVAEPPADHELYDLYNEIIENDLKPLRTYYGEPYNIIRIKTEPFYDTYLAAYTNSLILNKHVYVPLFSIPQDSMALRRWQEVMPGYTVRGFEFVLGDEPFVTEELENQYGAYGWNDIDALHCRTRAIWDPEMLFISVNPVDAEVDSKNGNRLFVTIFDYSGKGLVLDETKAVWKVAGEDKWNETRLISKEGEPYFSAELPTPKSGNTIEYYVTANSKSGATETKPNTAPYATYKF